MLELDLEAQDVAIEGPGPAFVEAAEDGNGDLEAAFAARRAQRGTGRVPVAVAELDRDQFQGLRMADFPALA